MDDESSFGPKSSDMGDVLSQTIGLRTSLKYHLRERLSYKTLGDGTNTLLSSISIFMFG